MTATATYRVDSLDCIVWVDPSWVEFARSNGAPELGADRILGHRLSEFVSGDEVRHLWGLVLQRVREEERPVTLPFRCDSPDRRRFMELDLAPLGDGRVELRARLLREEARDRVALLDSRVPRSDDVLPICSQCKRIQTPEDEWIEVEEGIQELDLFGAGLLPRLTHGLCDPCHASFENILRIQRSES